MPLTPTPRTASARKREKILQENIGKEIRAGKKPSQAAAIAYAEERRTSGGEGRNMIGEKCEIDDHRPCELGVTVGFAEDISQEAGVPLTPKLRRIVESNRGSEPEIHSALQEWQKSLPKDWKKSGQYVIEAAFPSDRKAAKKR